MSDEDKVVVRELLNLIGKAEEIDSSIINTVTAVSGSGPVYVYLLIEAMMVAAKNHGLSEEQARVFSTQTVIGGVTLLADSDETPAELINKVATPGGSSLEAVKVLKNDGFKATLVKAIEAAISKNESISNEAEDE